MNKCLYINLYGCTCILFLSGASSEIENPAGWEWVRSPISFDFFQFLIYTCGKSILFLSGASSEIVGSSIGCFCFGNTVIWKQSERRRKADWETFPNIDLNH